MAAALSRVPDELHGELRKQLRTVGEQVREDAAANASWSSRIPGALQMRVSFDGPRTGVRISASAKKAPHARVYEGIVDDPFRHPFFGNRDWWYEQAARPFLMPAAEKAHENVVAGALEAIDSTLARHGFGR
ncbi:hypothetical protein [Cellulomonas soli]|uniref:hypothetical protein n=1 Tax=Cellulomonas soli TaxID=931535 RepID=UPI003F84281E